MSDSPIKATTPAVDSAEKAGPSFTEREDRILKLVWLCLKSGPPEVDMDKLTKLGDFQTKKTASNTWGTIKKKLLSMASSTNEEGNGEGEHGACKCSSLHQTALAKSLTARITATPAKSTPKAKATPRKRGKKADAEGEAAADGGEDEVEGTPPKKQRKSPGKKGVKKEQAVVKAGPDPVEGLAEEDMKMEDGGE